MRSLRYLNTVLTLIAVLLTLNLWTMWSVTPGGELVGLATNASAAGIPNAGAQRKAMVDALKQVNVNLGAIHTMLKDGSVRVKIEALPEKK